MISLATSILLMLFVQAAIGSTSTTMAQETTTPQTTTPSQGTTTLSIATTSEGTTTPQTTTTARTITTSQTGTTSQGTITAPTTTTSQGTTPLPIATTSQVTTTPPIATTSQWTTTSPIATTSQGITTPQTTTTTQTTTTSQTSATTQTTTTSQTSATTQTTTTSQTSTTPQGTSTSPTTTTSQGTTTISMATTSESTTTPLTTTLAHTTTTSQTSITSQGTTTPPTTTTSQGTTTISIATTSQGTTTPQTTTTAQTTTTSQTSTTPPGTTTPQTNTTSQTSTTSQGTTTAQTNTTSQTSTTSQGSTNLQTTTTSKATTPLSSMTGTILRQSTIPATILTVRTIVSKATLTLQGTTSTRSPVLTPSEEPVAYEPDPGYYDLRLQFDLKLYLDFKDAYGDRTSTEFQNLATNMSVSLTEHFRYIKGFKSIEILQFRSGSVFVDYTVNVYGTVDILAVTNQIEKEAVDTLKDVAGVPVDVDYTRTSMKSRLGSLRTRDRCSLASANLCPFGYYCKQGDTTTLLCIDRCNVSVCENNGLCYIGHLSQDVQCKCPISDGAVFTGDRCQTKQVVMTIQERNLYLIIAGSIFGAFIVSFVLTVCIINRKRRILKKKLSINLRMNQSQVHKAGVKYIRDEHKRYADNNETDFNRQRQNIFDTADNPYQEGKAKAVDDGYIQAVQDVREDDGYLRASEGIRRKDDSEYDYIK